jgi:hypothetical protein
MENTAIERQPKKTDNNANQTSYYVSLTIAIIIGSLGQSTCRFSLIANLAILVASFLAFKVVFAILGFGSKKN